MKIAVTRTRKVVLGLLGAVLLVPAFWYYENNVLSVTRLAVVTERLPEAFDGYTIVQLSDLHGKWFGGGQAKLAAKVRAARPDLIVMTGDIVDRERGGEAAAVAMMRAMADIAPVYYVTGNHEWARGSYPELERRLAELGVRILRNGHADITRGGAAITLAGVDDPNATSRRASASRIMRGYLAAALDGLADEDDSRRFTILLAHRPELIGTYARSGVDLVYSGHAHGGQIRIPFVGGLFAPGQGFWPKYTAGLHRMEGTTMVVSRGLGNSSFPLRVFNRPEIVVTTLRKAAAGS